MIGERLRFIRRENKVRILEVASLLGISKTQYLKKERDEHKITAEEIQKLVDFYGVSASYFFTQEVAK